ncbi:MULTISPECIES: ROK family protein [unclassified Arthrobacter]|uniref:ROK family protein n=1 Tax=unclassified Arthrobacter TaxID=235627 RepID=UPI002882E4D2|nr:MULTISPECIES: ROK family protein [unclassified Arthrobacter]
MTSDLSASLPRDAGLGAAYRTGDLFQVLRDGKARTRAELVISSGLGRSAVASRIETLMRSGLVGPAGDAASSGGRPPTRYAFIPSARVVVAVDVGATHVTAAVTDLSGRVIAECRWEQNVADGPEVVLAEVVARGRGLLAVVQRDVKEVAGVGIGLPGPVEHGSGTPVRPPIMPGWDGFNVARYVRESMDQSLPVLVDNDVNMMAIGERAAHWPELKDLLFIKVATGIGSGIISSGQLQRGANGTAGDIGHVRVPRGDSVQCMCGNYGCLEALASGPNIARLLREQGQNVEEGHDVLLAAASGNRWAIQALRQAGRDIGDVVASAINLLNPSMVVVGGSIGQSGGHLIAGIREVVYQRSPALATSQLRIGLSKAGPLAAILGTSRMVTEHVLSPNVIEEAFFGQMRAG